MSDFIDILSALEVAAPNAGVLTSAAVEETIKACLYETAEDLPENPEITEGIVNRYAFDPAQLELHKAAIGRMLAELPDEFWADRGGGWAFQNACMDRHGNQWTGLHKVQEELMCLGIATGQARYVLPRSMWEVFGGLPYFSITPEVDT